MDCWEKWSSAILMLSGALLTLGVLAWFGLDHSGGGGFVSKVTEASGAGATQKTTTTEYSDTVIIFALATGAALLLAGGLYGRLRDLTLGPLKMGFAELPPDKQKTLDEAAKQTIEEKTPGKATPDLVASAQALARAQLQQQYWGPVPQPPEQTLQLIGQQAATAVLSSSGIDAE